MTRTLNDALAATAKANAGVGRDERAEAQALLAHRGFALRWTPRAGRVRVTSMSGWDALTRGARSAPGVEPAPV